MCQGALALFWFIASTLVLPGAHVYNHWRDHIHTANGVMFVDGHVESDERPASLQQLLNEVREAAFGVQPHVNDAAAAAARFSGSASCGPATPKPAQSPDHGDGSLLHFGLLFQECTPALSAVKVVKLLRVLTHKHSPVSHGRRPCLALHIRGPPAAA